jgi:hypothetical protein
MRTALIVVATIALCALVSVAHAQDDLADYPIKVNCDPSSAASIRPAAHTLLQEEQCENFGECLTECVKKVQNPCRRALLSPAAVHAGHFMFSSALQLPPNRQFTEILDCSDACAVTNCKEVPFSAPNSNQCSALFP